MTCSDFVRDGCADPFKEDGKLEVKTVNSGTWYEIDAMLNNGAYGKASVVSGEWTGTTDDNSRGLLTGSIRYVAGFVDNDGNVLCPGTGSPLRMTPPRIDVSYGHRRLPQVTCGQLQIFLD